MIELMSKGGMRISEVLKLTPADIDDYKLLLKEPKSGKESEVVYLHQKLSSRLKDYVRQKELALDSPIFPVTYSGARSIVTRAGERVGIKLRCHDLRRHAATFASRSGVPIEIVSKVILRHAHLATTQR